MRSFRLTPETCPNCGQPRSGRSREPKRWRRALLGVAATVVASLLGTFLGSHPRARQQQAGVVMIERMGGNVRYGGIWQRSSDSGTYPRPPRPEWLGHHLACVLEIDLSGANITDADLVHVSACPAVERLDLSNTRITDNAVARLATLERLRWLKVAATGLTEEGLRNLQRNLPDCKVQR